MNKNKIMNKLDKDYLALCQDILDNGTKKQTRNGDTLSVFGRQIRHSMKDGFPLLTTKKMYWKGIVTELIWFLRGDTNIKYLVDNDCHIWDGDAYKNYTKTNIIKNDDGSETHISPVGHYNQMTKEEFIKTIKGDDEIVKKMDKKYCDEFAKKWGDLGSIYGKQWRSWERYGYRGVQNGALDCGLISMEDYKKEMYIDQIADAIHKLKTNPDDRGIIVSAWNVGELDQMVLRPCHNFFQFYTRELSFNERYNLIKEKTNENPLKYSDENGDYPEHIQKPVLKWMEKENIPTRAISLMFNMRSVDVPLGLPFNIASYGLLLEIIAKMVNMVPDELIGNLGDCHIYTNQIEGIKEQIGRELSIDERIDLGWKGYVDGNEMDFDIQIYGGVSTVEETNKVLDDYCIPKRTREPYTLPKLNINTEFWPTESGECGEGPINAQAVLDGFSREDFCKCLMEEDIQLSNYKSHPAIKMPLSN